MRQMVQALTPGQSRPGLIGATVGGSSSKRICRALEARAANAVPGQREFAEAA